MYRGVGFFFAYRDSTVLLLFLAVWYMEVPSCTEWIINNGLNTFNPNCFVEVGKEGVEAKVQALSMYRGVMRPYPHPRSAEYIQGLAAMRGVQWGCEYAESFEVVLRKY